MTLKPLFLHYSPDDSLSSYFPRSLLVDCCLALYPFRTDALILCCKQKGVAALPPCQLGNMWSVDGHSSDCSRLLILTRPSRVAIRSQFAPQCHFFFFLLYLLQSIECTISLIQAGIDTDCIPSYIRSNLPYNSLHVLSVPPMITHCHHFSHLALQIHC